MLAVVLAPKVLALVELVAGAGLMLLGLLMLLVGLLRPRRLRHPLLDALLGLLMLLVGLLRPRRLRHPLLDALLVGGLLGWLVGRRTDRISRP